MPRYVTKHKDIPGVSMGYPTYVVWDTQEDSIATKDGLLLIFSSMTGEIACDEANKMTAELNGPTCTKCNDRGYWIISGQVISCPCRE